MAFTVRVPGSLSNLGPGFDLLGLAVGVHNRFVVTPLGAGEAVRTDRGPAEDHLLVRTLRAAEARFGRRVGVGFHVEGRDGVPWSRGLGSSATARVAGLRAWQALSGADLDDADAVAFLTAEEGHPDNVVAAWTGGCTLAVEAGGGVVVRRIPLPADLRVALAIPEVEVSTEAARAVLPDTVPLSDAVFTAGRLALLLEGLRTGDRDLLALGQRDRLHQDRRAALIGPVDPALEGARAAGAAAAFVSGSGSTLAALVVGDVDADRVAAALAAPFAAAGVACAPRVVAPDRDGVVVEGA